MANERSVLWVEDDLPFVRGMLRLLDLGALIEHVATCADALRALAERPRALVIADVNLPDGCGLDVVERSRDAARPSRAVVLTGLGGTDITVRAARLDARYVQKNAREGELGADLVAFLRAEIERAVVQRRDTEEHKLAVARDLVLRGRLTPKQAIVLELIAQGASRDDIAADTATTVKTTAKHLHAIFEKLAPIVREGSIRAMENWILERVVYELVRERYAQC